MKITSEEMKDGLLEIQVEVEAGEVDAVYDEAYKKVADNIVIPGFRKGKAPRRLVEARTRTDYLEEEVKKILLPKVYDWTVKERNLIVLDTQEIDGDVSSGEPSTVTILLEVIPEVELGQYTGLEIEMQRREVTEDKVEEQINQIRRNYSTLKAVERDVVEKGDYVILDYEGYLEGETFPDNSQQDIALQIGSGTFLEDFEEGCIGLKVGEEGTVSVSYPEDLAHEKLAGQEVDYQVLIKDIKEIVLPPLDDEWVASLYKPEITTVSALKESIRQNLEEEVTNYQDQEYERLLLDEIARNSTIEFPPQLLEEETDLLVTDTIKQSKPSKRQELEKQREELKTLLRPQAESRIKDRLVLNAVVKKEGFKAETDEVEEKITQLAAQNKMEVKQYKRKMFKEKKLDKIKGIILSEKALIFLHENNFAVFSPQEDENPEESV